MSEKQNGKIRLLTDEVIGKIAAGEVVERPAAAIKELVENSLDAGATAVTVEIRDGGVSYFRVTDNGCGIAQSDIRMAFERHATSKISAAADLFSISTLGFRGEALASIAAVAHVTCTTRTVNDLSGVRVQNDGGQITSIEEAACPEGTTFVVRDLFFNTPVRLKFLKKPVTETGFVSDLMMRLILSRPDVSFRYVSQGKTLYHSAGDGQLESAVFSIYGSEMLRSMRKMDGHGGGLTMSGYVGIGDSARGNRSHQSFFINGRYMHSPLLSAALENACRERVMIGRFPICVLHLTMPYDTVDVNVHPNKLEVRFQNEQAVGEAVEAIIREGLTDRDALARPVPLILTPDEPATLPVQVTKQTPVIPESNELDKNRPDSIHAAVPSAPASAPAAEVRPRAPIPSVAAVPVLRDNSAGFAGFAPPTVLPQPALRPFDDPPQAAPEQTASFLPAAPKPLKLLGVVFDTFILVEYADHLLLIDQHAVHERLLFDQMMAAYDRHQAGQELLTPLVVTVTRREQEILEENRELLTHLGLTVEPFGDSEVSVRSIPMILGAPQTKEFLTDMLDELENERGSITLAKRRSAILQMACKRAVKGGDRLSEDEIRDLVTRMIDQKVTPTCPHGRPLVVALSHQELDRRFKRIQ